MNVVILGDSHTGIFKKQAPIWTTKAAAFTAHRFCTAWPEIWSELDPWVTLADPDLAVISVGEIDIRGHWWRHMPRSSQIPVTQQIQTQVLNFRRAIEQWADRHAVKRVVIWGPPPATDRAAYNPDWPFVGSAITRNQLIAEYNREHILASTDRIVYTTAWYNYVNQNNWTTMNYTETDGVHYADHLGSQFWNELIIPALNGTYLTVPRAIDLKWGTQLAYPQTLYDTWIRTRDLLEPVLTSRQIEVDGENYTFMNIMHNRNQWPEQYQELALVRSSTETYIAP